MAEEPTVPTPFDAIDLQSLSDEELQRLTGKQTDFAPVWASFHARAASPPGHPD